MAVVRRALLASLLSACARVATLDAGADAEIDAGGAVCGCRPGPHASHVYVLGDDGALYAFDPRAGTFDFVIGPVCASLPSPYSMAVDPAGRLWILEADSRRIQRFDLLAPGPCDDPGYLPTNAEFPLFGMGFSTPSADADCAQLFVHSYSGSGPFREGTELGAVGVIDGAPLGVRRLGPSAFDGAEVTGTGDGRVFLFGGTSPAKLVEIDRTTGAPRDVFPLDGLPRTNASAFAFFGGDFYLFTEALPDGCGACLETECGAAWTSCAAEAACAAEVDCAIAAGRVTDACGGGAGAEVLACLGTCGSACLTSSAARVSQVTLLDWDRTDGTERTLRRLDVEVPIRVVGAGTSPCVPTTPF